MKRSWRAFRAHRWFVLLLLCQACASFSSAAPLPVEGEFPSLDQASTWLNSPRLKVADLRGKVVLVDFWTYTCINWRRTLPYLRIWADKYRDRGLVVIGVHTPEFSFERDIGNVRQASKDQAVSYPIAIDSAYGVWNAFDNHYWPALYLVDAQGRIRHHQFGEGDYEKLELMIQQLLAEAGRGSPDAKIESIAGNGAEAAADWKDLKSPETYLGLRRSDSFSSPESGFFERARNYTTPEHLRLNRWGLTGNWTIGDESARSNYSGARLIYRFHARDVHLVMGAVTSGSQVRYRVLIDGQPPGPSHGVDVDEQGNGKMDAPRMYQLIRQHGSIADHNFEIEFEDPGAEIFVLTFG